MKIVIVGGSGVGRHLAASLTADADVVVVDRDPVRLAEVEESVDALTLVGDGRPAPAGYSGSTTKSGSAVFSQVSSGSMPNTLAVLSSGEDR